MNAVIRPIALHDLPAYIECAKSANFSFTTLPRDPVLAEKRLHISLESFQKNVVTPGDEFYLFVAENIETGAIMGISAISATTGGKDPLYFFRNESYSVSSQIDDIVRTIPILTPVSYVRSSSEICSLFVLAEYQKLGFGRLLSFSRFLFMKAFMKRFTGTIFAELRGCVDENLTSIFWNGVGRHFFTKSLYDVYDMLQYGKAFIAEFLPKYPIYTELLPEAVQESIGKNDTDTQGALRLLTEIGFQKTSEVDVFDAGPKLSALKENISIIKEAKIVQITDIKESIASPLYFASNMHIDFRACMSHIAIKGDTVAEISRKTAKALSVGLGDSIIIYPMIYPRSVS